MKQSKDIIIKKGDLIVKSNDLIQSSYRLNIIQQKIMLFLISKLDQDIMVDKDLFETYFYIDVSFNELKKILDPDITKKNKNHSYIIKILKSLKEKTLILKGKNEIYYTGWILKFTHFRFSSSIRVYIDPDLKPFLLNLKRFFTQYRLENVIRFKNTHSFRMYELLKQYLSIARRIMNIEELKYYLGLQGKYKLFTHFKNKVIDISVLEINEFSDIKVDYKVIREGKTPKKIDFKIKKKDFEKELKINPFLLDKLKSISLNRKQINKICSDCIKEHIKEDSLIEKINFIIYRKDKIHNLQYYSYKILMNYIDDEKNKEQNKTKMDLSIDINEGDLIEYENKQYKIEPGLMVFTNEGVILEQLLRKMIKKGIIKIIK